MAKNSAKNSTKNGSKAGRPGPRLAASLEVLWRTFCRDTFDPYRPELHYMRGPGPKWRAKHGVTEPAARHATPAAA